MQERKLKKDEQINLIEEYRGTSQKLATVLNSFIRGRESLEYDDPASELEEAMLQVEIARDNFLKSGGN